MHFRILKQDDLDYGPRFDGLFETALQIEIKIWSNLTHDPKRTEEFIKRFSHLRKKFPGLADFHAPQAILDMLKASIHAQKANLTTIQGHAELDRLHELLD